MARVTIPTTMNSSGPFIISPYKRSQPSVKPISRRKAPRVTTMTITSNMELLLAKQGASLLSFMEAPGMTHHAFSFVFDKGCHECF